MYCSIHVKNAFESAKENRNVICLKYNIGESSYSKECVLVEFEEKQDRETFQKKLDLYLWDLTEKTGNNMIKLDISNVHNFTVTNKIYC